MVEQHFVKSRFDSAYSGWTVFVDRDATEIFGEGGEAIVRQVQATFGNHSVPLVLKSYDESYDAGQMVHMSRNSELTSIFLNRQYWGYNHLQNANRRLIKNRYQPISIVPTCRISVQQNNLHLGLVQTDLSQRGRFALIEAKELLDISTPRSIFSMAIARVGLEFTTALYNDLIRYTITAIEEDVKKAAHVGIVFRPPDPIPEYGISFHSGYPHQFSGWVVRIDSFSKMSICMHDYSNVHTTGDRNYVRNAVYRAQEIFRIQ